MLSSRLEPGGMKNSRGSPGGWLNVLADFQEPQPTVLPKCRMSQGSGTPPAFQAREGV